MPPKRKIASTTVAPPKSRRRTGTARTQPPPSLVEQTSKLQLESTNRTDPLAVLDDLCLDLVFQEMDLKDLVVVCGISRLWAMRLTCWIVNSRRRMKDEGVLMPKGIDVQQDPLSYAVAWRRTALKKILREAGRPWKAIKLTNVACNICSVSGPYVAWIETEKLKYQWATEYLPGAAQTDYSTSTGAMYLDFIDAWLCVQRVIDPVNANAPLGKVRRVSFQKIFNRQIKKNQTGNYQPMSLKLWTPKDNSRIIGILEAIISNASGVVKPVSGNGHDTGGTSVTLFIDLISFKVLWHIDHRERDTCSTLPDTAISESGHYSMMRDRPRDQARTDIYNPEVSVYDILTGDVIFKVDWISKNPDRWMSYTGEKYHLRNPTMAMHPHHDIAFLFQEYRELAVVTPTGNYKFPEFPVLQSRANGVDRVLRPFHLDCRIPQGLQMTFDVSSNSNTFHVGICYYYVRNHPQVLPGWDVYVDATYQLPADITSAAQADWANVKLVRVRIYDFPIRCKFQIRPSVDVVLNQMIFREQPTDPHPRIITWKQEEFPSNWGVKIADSATRPDDKLVPVEFWKMKDPDGATITTRRRTAQSKRKPCAASLYWDPLIEEDRKPISLGWLKEKCGTITSDWAMMYGPDSVVVAYF